MRPEEAREAIRAAIRISPALVAQAKQAIVAAGGGRGPDLVHAFERSVTSLPQPVVVHPTANTEEMIRDAAAALSARAAAIEAVASLAAQGVLLMASGGYYEVSFDLQYTTVVPGSGGESGGWRFDDLRYHVPAEVLIAPSYRFGSELVLGDSDLFLGTLGIADVHPLVNEALREAVACFRRDLFTPCLAMLAKAIDGAWTELGLALADALPGTERSRADRLRDDLADPMYSLARRVHDVASLYERRDLLDDVWRQSGVRSAELRQAVIWSDQVRDSRNVVHFAAEANVPNTFEKVSVLMLAAIGHLRTLYEVRAGAVTVGAGQPEGRRESTADASESSPRSR